MLIHTYDESELAKRAGEKLGTLLGNNKDILFLSSGGSALEILKTLPVESTCENLTVGVLDERWNVLPNDRNFQTLKETHFFKECLERGGTALDLEVKEADSLRSFTERFEKMLRGWKKAHPDGEVIITQGIGIDGHTAGIMPRSESKEGFYGHFDNPEYWVVGYDAGKEKTEFPFRVTVTLPFLREAVNVTIVYVRGNEKREALQKTLEGTGTLHETPARIIQEMRQAEIFTNSKL